MGDNSAGSENTQSGATSGLEVYIVASDGVRMQAAMSMAPGWGWTAGGLQLTSGCAFAFQGLGLILDQNPEVMGQVYPMSVVSHKQPDPCFGQGCYYLCSLQ